MSDFLTFYLSIHATLGFKNPTHSIVFHVCDMIDKTLSSKKTLCHHLSACFKKARFSSLSASAPVTLGIKNMSHTHIWHTEKKRSLTVIFDCCSKTCPCDIFHLEGLNNAIRSCIWTGFKRWGVTTILVYLLDIFEYYLITYPLPPPVKYPIG